MADINRGNNSANKNSGTRKFQKFRHPGSSFRRNFPLYVSGDK